MGQRQRKVKPFLTHHDRTPMFPRQVSPQLTTIQTEVSQTVAEMCKLQKTYNIDEAQAFEARAKAKDAEEK